MLETGCGDGRLWVDNIKNVEKLKNIKITVTDISEGMVNDARRNIGNGMFDYGVADCMNLPFDDNSFDCVIANHVIFYCEEPGKAFKEIKRVLKPEERPCLVHMEAIICRKLHNWLISL